MQSGWNFREGQGDNYDVEHTPSLSGRDDAFALDRLRAAYDASETPPPGDTTYVINSGGKAHFVSKNGSIILKPGFHAQNGCSFTAKIDTNMTYWDGGSAADYNWGTDENWGGNWGIGTTGVPTAASVVYYGNRTSSSQWNSPVWAVDDCIMQAVSAAVAEIRIEDSYSGTFTSTTGTLTMGGNIYAGVLSKFALPGGAAITAASGSITATVKGDVDFDGYTGSLIELTDCALVLASASDKIITRREGVAMFFYLYRRRYDG